MNDKALELYLYMGNSEAVIKQLKSEKITTRQQAIRRLSPLVRGLVISSISLGGSLAGAANGSNKILDAFPDTPVKSKKKLLRKK